MSQFSGAGDKQTLADFNFPKGVYPIGRLDFESEGLLILSDDKILNHKLLNPKFQHKRTYWAQVEGIPNKEKLNQFKNGLEIKINSKPYTTKAADIKVLDNPIVGERNPPIRFRKEIPTTWCEINLKEGKNRQVRKMTAAIGFPTLRLLRVAIEDLKLEGLEAGDKIELSRNSIYKKLRIQ